MKRFVYNIWYIFQKEMKAVSGDSAVLTFFVALTFMYPIIYTGIYTKEVVREVPVAVVDAANSSASRDFIRRWDASPNVKVIARAADMNEARHLLYEKKVYGILEIPADFSSRIARGDKTYVSLFADMGGLLNYKALLQAATDVSLMMGGEIQVEDLPYATVKHQKLVANPVKVEEVKMFNPQSGYASFIIPAILILVIQQSLLLGVGTLAGTSRERSRYGRMIPLNGHYRNALQIILAKALAYLPFYLVACVWIYVVVPGMFQLTRIGLKWDLFLFLFPFLLSSIFLAVSVSFLCKERETPFLIFVFTSVPLMFISGISWPLEAVPWYWQLISKVFPSTFGIEGYVRINNMGATLKEVYPQFYALWILVVFYFILAYLLYLKELKKMKNIGCRWGIL